MRMPHPLACWDGTTLPAAAPKGVFFWRHALTPLDSQLNPLANRCY